MTRSDDRQSRSSNPIPEPIYKFLNSSFFCVYQLKKTIKFVMINISLLYTPLKMEHASKTSRRGHSKKFQLSFRIWRCYIASKVLSSNGVLVKSPCLKRLNWNAKKSICLYIKCMFFTVLGLRVFSVIFVRGRLGIRSWSSPWYWHRRKKRCFAEGRQRRSRGRRLSFPLSNQGSKRSSAQARWSSPSGSLDIDQYQSESPQSYS